MKGRGGGMGRGRGPKGIQRGGKDSVKRVC